MTGKTGKRSREEAIRKRGLAAILLAGLLAGCATGATGTSNWLTLLVDNFDGQGVVVSIGQDVGCQVDSRAIRHECRYAWAGTGDLELQIYVPAQNRTHVAQFEEVSSGDRLCLQVRSTGVQLRSC